MSTNKPTTSTDLPAQQPSHAPMILMGVLLFIVAMLLGATIYSFGQRAESFRWSTFRSGGMVFVMVVAGIAAGGLILSLLIRLLAAVSPTSFQMLSERSQLKKARRRAVKAIDRRHTVQEEQARLTAMMQAAYLFERESARTANAKALAEFRKALQSGVVRSCEVAFDHLNQTVEQYEQVVAEIESSSLSDAEKADLLDKLSRQLDVGNMTQRHRSAQRMMEDAIWRVRFQKARILASRNPESALRYLRSIRKPDMTQRVLIQIDAMLNELDQPG